MTSSKRIALAGINHETNTYCRGETEVTDFFQIRGERMLRAKGRHTGIGGALVACEKLGFEPVPLLFVTAQPSGVINRETYEQFKLEILDGLEQQAPIDAIYLDLHGAGVVDGLPDMEADLTTDIRALIGPDVPMVASFDLHGNISQKMADALDGLFACHHYPHIDFHLRAIEAIELVNEILNHGVTTTIHVESLPMLMPTTTTFEGVGEKTLNQLLALEEAKDVIDVSWFHGFPYTDIPQVGCHIAVTTKQNMQLAQHQAKEAADCIWQNREAFRPTSLSAQEAFDAAITFIETQKSDQNWHKAPVVINENSDNCGGGAPGDGTHLLSVMLEAAKLDQNSFIPKMCFGFIVDAAAAAVAFQHGVGSTINIELGGHYDDIHGETLMLRAYVKSLHDGRVTMQAMNKGTPLDLGNTARLVIGAVGGNGVEVIVASNRSQTFDPAPFEAVGINVNEYDIVALKSSNHFRAGFSDLAATIITADPPGLMTHHIEVFPRQHCPEKMWPIADDASYQG